MELMELSAILKAKRMNERTIVVKCNEKFEAARYEQPIDILLCVSYALGDDLLTVLSGLASNHFSEITKLNALESRSFFADKNIDFLFTYMIKHVRIIVSRLQTFENTINRLDDIETLEELILAIIKLDNVDVNWRELSDDTVFTLVQTLEYCLSNKLLRNACRSLVVEKIWNVCRDTQRLSQKPIELFRYFSLMTCRRILIPNDIGFVGGIPHEFGIVSPDYNRSTNTENRFEVFIQDQKMSYNERLYYQHLVSSFTSHRVRETENAFKREFNEDVVKTLASLNPDLLLDVFLAFLDCCERTAMQLRRTMDELIIYGFSCLKNEGIEYLRVGTVYKAIKLAKKVEAIGFLSETSDLLIRYVFSHDNTLIGKLLFYNPIFAVNFISIIPQKNNRRITPGLTAYLKEVTFGENYLKCENIENLIAHIKILEFISDSSILSKPTDLPLVNQSVEKTMRLISQKLELSGLSTNLIDELQTTAEWADDSELVNKILSFKNKWE